MFSICLDAVHSAGTSTTSSRRAPIHCKAHAATGTFMQARKSLKACRVVNTTEEAIGIATLKLEASQVELDAAQSAVDAAAAAEASAAAETADGVEEEEGK